MKKLIITSMIVAVFPSCDSASKSKIGVKNDSTILAPETNSNMTDTRPVATDSSMVDSSHLKEDTPMTK